MLEMILYIVGGLSLSGCLLFFVIFTDKDEQRPSRETPPIREMPSIPEGNVGQQAQSITKLSPGGQIKVSGTKYDAVTDADYVDADRAVEITGIRMGQYVVREVKETEVGETPNVQQ